MEHFSILFQELLANFSCAFSTPTRASLLAITLGYRGRDSALACATPPSEPDVRISRIRLSGRWFYLMRIGVKLDGHL